MWGFTNLRGHEVWKPGHRPMENINVRTLKLELCSKYNWDIRGLLELLPRHWKDIGKAVPPPVQGTRLSICFFRFKFWSYRNTQKDKIPKLYRIIQKECSTQLYNVQLRLHSQNSIKQSLQIREKPCLRQGKCSTWSFYNRWTLTLSRVSI